MQLAPAFLPRCRSVHARLSLRPLLFGPSATYKECRLLLEHMLGDVAPWYLPLMFGGCMLWCFAPSLLPWCEERGVLGLAYKWAPPVMVGGLILYRANAIFSLDFSHLEVATILTPSSSRADQMTLMFTGQGAIEGALLSLMVFSVLSPNLPSLRAVGDEHRQAVQQGLMRHSGWWILICVVLLFPDSRYFEPDSLPSSPTVALASWWSLASIVCFTLLLIMSGEIVASTSLLTTNDSTSLLFQRAVLKLLILLPVACYAMAQTEVLSEAWWARPMHDSNQTVALMVLVYGLLICCVHAPAAWMESGLGQGDGQSVSMTWGYGGVVALCFLVCIGSVNHVALFGTGMQVISVSLRLTSFVALAGALSMLLPTMGYDSAHRPELWWLRFTLYLCVPVGSLFSVSFWLLIPLVFAAGILTLNLPWILEEHPFEMFHKPLIGWTALIGLSVILGLISATSYAMLVILFGTLLIANALFMTLGMNRWAHQNS